MVSRGYILSASYAVQVAQYQKSALSQPYPTLKIVNLLPLNIILIANSFLIHA